MFRKLLIAAAATAAIGTAALAPTAASAGWHHHGGPIIGIGFFGGPDYADCYMAKRKVLTEYGWRRRWVRVCE